MSESGSLRCEEMTVKRRQSAPVRAGLVLLSRAVIPIYANSEALDILGYPREPNSVRSLGDPRVRAVLSDLFGSGSPRRMAAIVLSSGRRRYTCRTFPLVGSASASQPLIAVLIDRGSANSAATIREVRDRFRLTVREGEATALLMRGLTNKEIAERMLVSPNTVKTFVKFVMLKMGVSTRGAVTAKVQQRKG